MNTVEDRLREALHRRAERSPAMELPVAMERIRHRVRRQRRRQATGSVVAVVAVAAAALFAVPAVIDAMPAGIGDPSLTRPSTAAPRAAVGVEREWSDIYREAARRYPPVGPITVVTDLGSDGHGIRLRAWLSTERVHEFGEPLLCHAYVLGDGGGGHGCRPGALSALPRSPEGLIRVGSSGAAAEGANVFGIADQRVRSVAVRLGDGDEIPGTLVGIKGSTARFWHVRAPEMGTAQAVVVNGTVLEPFDTRVGVSRSPAEIMCRPGSRPSTGVVDLGGSGNGRISAGLSNGCVGFWIGSDPGGKLPLDPQHTHADGWGRWTSARWWYGVADPTTVRVQLRLADGRQITGRLIRPDWKGTRVVLYAGDRSQVKNLRGSKVIGYDAAGRVLRRR